MEESKTIVQQPEQPKPLFGILSGTSPVRIVANEQQGGIIITPLVDKETGKPKLDVLEYPLGSIMLEQVVVALDGGFLNSRRRVAFISGRLDLLEQIVNNNKLEAGSELPGRITVIESLIPQYKNHMPKINPSTDTQIGVTIGTDFHPVYMRMLYDETGKVPDKMLRTADAVLLELSKQIVAKAEGGATAEEARVPVGNAATPAGAEAEQ